MRKHSMRQELDGAHVSTTLITETRQNTSPTYTYKEINNLEQHLNMDIHNKIFYMGCQYFVSSANMGISGKCNITTTLWRELLHITQADTPTTLRIVHTQEYLATTFCHGALALQNPSLTLTRYKHPSVPCLHTLHPHSSTPKPNNFASH